VELLRAGTETGKSHAAWAIGQLAKDAASRALIIASSALPPLVELLRSGSEKGKGKTAFVMAELAKDVATCALIIAAGALPLVVELLRSCPEAIKSSVASLIVGLATEIQLENSALRTERDALAEGFESLASLVGPVTNGHDVVFRLPGGERIGGSRLLLAHVSPYYERLLLGGMAEGTSDVEPDPDFSSAAHIALLSQLHALGHAALPASLDVLLELVYLAAKVHGAPSGEGDGADAAVRVFEQCERALRDSLCAGNCLAVLLRLKPYAAEVPGLVDAAHAVVVVHVAMVLKQPEWNEFRKQYPDSAFDILQDIALEQASIVAEQASRLAELSPEADGSARG